ncbi:MAG: AI-2E family transporter [Terracidiphilus sp.]
MTTQQESARVTRGNIVFTFALVLALYVAWILRDVLVLLYVSALFAVVLSPAVRATSNVRFGKWRPFEGSAAIFILLLAAAGLIVVFFSLAVPPIVRDLQGFSGEMPSRLPILLAKLHQIPFADRIDTSDIVSRLQDSATETAGYVLTSARNWAGALARIVVGFVLTLYFLLEGDRAYHWLLSFLPGQKRKRLDATLQRASVRMGKWLLGQATLMLLLGFTSTIVFASLHLRYAYALGVLTGLLNIVPVLGAAISLVLALLVAAIDSWGRVLGVAIFFVAYFPLENYYLVPLIMKNRVNLPALAIFVALLLGSALEGVLGAMVAIPTAVLISVLLDEYLVNKAD